MDKDSRKYTMPVDQALELLDESEKQISMVRDFLEHTLLDHTKDYINQLLCESFCINYKLISQVENIAIAEDEDQEELQPDTQLVMDGGTAKNIEYLVLARYFLVKELSSVNISTQLH
jgi:hypothetical protein